MCHGSIPLPLIVADSLRTLSGAGLDLTWTHSLTNLSCHGQTLGVSDRGKLLVSQPLYGVLVVSQIQLSAHQDDGCVWAVVSNLRVPLRHRTYAYRKDKVSEGEREREKLV